MYEKLEQCPVCNYTRHDNFLICDDHSVSRESFALVRCARCHTVYTNPRPSRETISSYYQSEDYISHTGQSTNLVNFIYKIARRFTLRWKYNIIKKYHAKPGHILDFGAGTGEFLRYFKTKGWDTVGVEPNQQARDIATDKDLHVFAELSKKTKSQYDIITAWHVLEHVHDLKDTLRRLRKRLSDSGHLIVALPNHLSHDAQHYGAHWAGYDVPRHLYHFSPETLLHLAQQTKFQIKDILPMPLDAYYVSILSEQYAESPRPFLNGLKIGWQSNRSAAKGTKQYSSLIYVLTK